MCLPYSRKSQEVSVAGMPQERKRGRRSEREWGQIKEGLAGPQKDFGFFSGGDGEPWEIWGRGVT